MIWDRSWKILQLVIWSTALQCCLYSCISIQFWLLYRLEQQSSPGWEIKNCKLRRWWYKAWLRLCRATLELLRPLRSPLSDHFKAKKVCIKLILYTNALIPQKELFLKWVWKILFLTLIYKSCSAVGIDMCELKKICETLN